jgi:hypothetical protein
MRDKRFSNKNPFDDTLLVITYSTSLGQTAENTWASKKEEQQQMT